MNTCLTCGEHYSAERRELCGCYSDLMREHARGHYLHQRAVEQARAQGMEDPVFIESFAVARMTEQGWQKCGDWWQERSLHD